MMAQFEGAAKKKVQADVADTSVGNPQRRNRSRSRSPPRRRSPSPDRGRSHDSRRDYRNGGRDRAPLDERPILFKIYNGRISSLKDFGAFVQVEGVAGRVEGKESSCKQIFFLLTSL
jgi:ATP-dependent RNA helicase DHX8/PRP22